jgi:hypothetical protein
MKRKGTEGADVVHRISPAANEEFTAMVNALDRLSRPHSGWDPYEVWRTRVKESATVMRERERAPSRWQVTAGAAGRRLRTALQSVTNFATLAADLERNVRER